MSLLDFGDIDIVCQVSMNELRMLETGGDICFL